MKYTTPHPSCMALFYLCLSLYATPHPYFLFLFLCISCSVHYFVCQSLYTCNRNRPALYVKFCNNVPSAEKQGNKHPDAKGVALLETQLNTPQLTSCDGSVCCPETETGKQSPLYTISCSPQRSLQSKRRACIKSDDDLPPACSSVMLRGVKAGGPS